MLQFRILIVDDEDSSYRAFNDAIKRVFRMVEIDRAITEEAACKRINEKNQQNIQYDIAILDVMLPRTKDSGVPRPTDMAGYMKQHMPSTKQYTVSGNLPCKERAQSQAEFRTIIFEKTGADFIKLITEITAFLHDRNVRSHIERLTKGRDSTHELMQGKSPCLTQAISEAEFEIALAYPHLPEGTKEIVRSYFDVHEEGDSYLARLL
jgi:hypothetical protein